MRSKAATLVLLTTIAGLSGCNSKPADKSVAGSNAKPKLGIRPHGDETVQPDMSKVPDPMKKVFSYIKHLQATSPVWNAETTNCTSFIGRIASFMGLETPFHLKMPEEYVNQLKALNGGRRMVRLESDR